MIGASMDTCGICGRQRTADLKFSRVKDAWICNECLRASGLAKEYPDFSQRNKAMKSMPIAELRNMIEEAKAQQAEMELRKAEEAEENYRKEQERAAKWENRDAFPVTTVDLNRPYEVIGPVFFQTSNKGLFSSAYGKLAKEYLEELKKRREDGTFSPTFTDWGFLIGTGWTVGQNDFDPAFYIAVEELKRRAIVLDADAIVGLKVDFDLDTNGFQYFYLQAYGTAVRFTE